MLHDLHEADEKKIVGWPLDDLDGLLDFLAELWDTEFGKVEIVEPAMNNESRLMRFVTGGWSYNESILTVAYEHPLLTASRWHKSERGGLHEYIYKGEVS